VCRKECVGRSGVGRSGVVGVLRNWGRLGVASARQLLGARVSGFPMTPTIWQASAAAAVMTDISSALLPSARAVWGSAGFKSSVAIAAEVAIPAEVVACPRVPVPPHCRPRPPEIVASAPVDVTTVPGSCWRACG